MKYLLICLIMLSGVVMGNTFIVTARKRMEFLKSLESCANAIVNSMTMRGMTLMRALKELDDKDELGIFATSCEVIEKDPNIDAQKAVLKAFSIVKPDSIDEDIIKSTALFIGAVSKASTASQIEQAAMAFKDMLFDMEKETKEIKLRRAKAARNLCLFSGIAIGIILI